MRKSLLLASAVSAASLLSWGAQAQAQESSPAATTEQTEVEAVVVTGSFIGRSAETTALPVDVISQEEIEKKGTPNMVEQIKSLTASSGVVGDSNQFGAPGSYGNATVNLRGLGSARNLVLLNGKRLAEGDLNTIPMAAIGRVEVLKEGASTTYGSDAIAGVVNFITRKPFTGLELNANYRYIDGSDGGDYGASILGGFAGDHANLLVSLAYSHRSDLPVTERDWAVRPYATNPEGGWTTGSNPSRFYQVDDNYAFVGAGSPVATADPGCVALGGLVNPTGVCAQQYILWDNLVDEQDQYQAYAEFNADLTDKISFHAEALYARTDIEGVNTTPSFTTVRGPSVNALPDNFSGQMAANFPLTQGGRNTPDMSNYFYVPAANPGFIALQNAGVINSAATGAMFRVGTYRPFLAGGNPLFKDLAPGIENKREQTRVSAGFKGTIGEWGPLGTVDFATDLTYTQYDNRRDEYDTVANRLQLAMRGLGGPNCDYVNGTPGANGCLWFNPFSNAIPANGLTGAANPGYVASTANDLDVIRWFYQRADQTRSSSRLFEGNFVLNGESKLALPGGNVGWAAGVQWRREGLVNNPPEQSSRVANGCLDSLTPAIQTTNNCYPQNGPFVFLGQINDVDVSRNIYAAFAELDLPILENLNVNLAGRYEDYGDYGGDTFNPKVSVRWQAFDVLAFRASYSSTFRAPPQTSLIPDVGISMASILGTYRGVATTGNPDLKPETADTWTVGAIFKAGGLKASLDYYNIKLDDVLGVEPRQEVLDTVFPNGATGADRCGDAALADYIAQHFTFAGSCSAANLTQINLLRVNRGTIETDGFDFLADYSIPGAYWGSEFGVGGTISYINSYKVNGVDVAGLANAYGGGVAATSLPQTKAELYGEATHGPHNLRLTFRYIGSYTDDRATVITNATPYGGKVKPQEQVDLAYRVFLPKDTTLSLQVQNVFDKDPPFARTELSYDPFTGNPLGRTFQVSVKKAF